MVYLDIFFTFKPFIKGRPEHFDMHTLQKQMFHGF